MLTFASLGKLLALVSVFVAASGRSIGKDFLWFPKDGGEGFIPGFLNSSSSGIIAPTANPDHIKFFLYTRQNPDDYDTIDDSIDSITNSHWDVNAPVKIFAHGFASSATSGSAEEIKRGYITNGYPENVNLVLVQWKRLALPPFYFSAAENTQLVGEKIAHLVNFLVENQFTTISKLHLGGHSLGAHAVGIAGSLFQESNPGKIIPRITGLDPALPLFGLVDDIKRIDPTDAEMVDIIHTAAGNVLQGELAFVQPMGTVDFYPNKGRDQPGCEGLPDIGGACSHSRCYEYFSESIQNDLFKACRCNDDAWDPEGDDKFTSCSCDKGEANLGEWTSSDARGIYYLETNAQSPYAIVP